MVIKQREERGNGRGGHGEERGIGKNVAQVRAGAPQSQVDRREENADRSALPQGMNERPAERIHQRRFHHAPPVCSNSSSICRISASSSGLAFLVARACITMRAAEPPKTRSSISPTNCRCV